MKLIVGLGNPGSQYEKTRHNVGFVVVEKLAQKLGASFSKSPKLQVETARGLNPVNQEKYILVKPQTFMNNSGQAVRAVLDFYQLDAQDLILIYDDLDLELGSFKAKVGGFPKGHNGVNSVIQHLGGEKKGGRFLNIRIGIDGREGDRSIPSDKYVLQQFTSSEVEKARRVISKIVATL